MALRFFAAMAFACFVATAGRAEQTNSPALIYSPWIKFCLGDTCFTGRDGRFEADCPAGVAAVLIERNGDTKKNLRVTLPRRVNPERGVRIIIDQAEAIERPLGPCYASGCMADHVAGAELIGQLRQGKMIVLKAFDRANVPIDLTVPLDGFAGAYDGPATEPKVFEETISTAEMQARAERAKREEADRKARCGAGRVGWVELFAKPIK